MNGRTAIILLACLTLVLCRCNSLTGDEGSNLHCLDGFELCNGTCRNVSSDFQHCGACGQPCVQSGQACIDGQCVNACYNAETAEPDKLAAWLRGEGVPSGDGGTVYFTVTNTTELKAAEVREGAIFITSGASGIQTAEPFEYGVDEANSSECCAWLGAPMFPQQGYQRVTFAAESSFTLARQSYEDEQMGSCVDSFPDKQCFALYAEDGLDCMSPDACCCATLALPWHIVTFLPVPEACTSYQSCDGFTGRDPTVCFGEYSQYMRSFEDHLHFSCWDQETGLIYEGSSCVCDTGWDVAHDVAGTCSADGRCATKGPIPGDGYIPPECR